MKEEVKSGHALIPSFGNSKWIQRKMPKSVKKVLPYALVLLFRLSPNTFFSSDKVEANCQKLSICAGYWERRFATFSCYLVDTFCLVFFFLCSLPFLLQSCEGWAGCLHMLMPAKTHVYTRTSSSHSQFSPSNSLPSAPPLTVPVSAFTNSSLVSDTRQGCSPLSDLCRAVGLQETKELRSAAGCATSVEWEAWEAVRYLPCPCKTHSCLLIQLQVYFFAIGKAVFPSCSCRKAWMTSEEIFPRQFSRN